VDFKWTFEDNTKGGIFKRNLKRQHEEGEHMDGGLKMDNRHKQISTIPLTFFTRYHFLYGQCTSKVACGYVGRGGGGGSKREREKESAFNEDVYERMNPMLVLGDNERQHWTTYAVYITLYTDIQTYISLSVFRCMKKNIHFVIVLHVCLL
jgi:hypothetical protein